MEEYLDAALSSIREALQEKAEASRTLQEARRTEAERHRVRGEEDRQMGEEEQRVEKLEQVAKAWRRCQKLRAFMAAWEETTTARIGEIQSGSPEDAWRRWALNVIEEMDPLKPKSGHNT